MNKIDVLNKIVKYLTRIHNDYDNNEYKQKFYQYSDLYTQINSNNFSKEQYGGDLTDDLLNRIDMAYEEYLKDKTDDNKKNLSNLFEQISDMDPGVLFTALKTKFDFKQLEGLSKNFSNLMEKESTTEEIVKKFNEKAEQFDNKFSTFAIIYILYSKQRLSNNFDKEFNENLNSINKIIEDTNQFLNSKKSQIPNINGLEYLITDIESILNKTIEEINNYENFENLMAKFADLLTETRNLLSNLSNDMSTSLEQNNKQKIINLNTYYYFLTGILDTLKTKESMLKLTKIKFDTLKTENEKNSKNLDNIFELIEYFKKYIETSKKFMKLKSSENLDLSQLVVQVNELTQNLSNLTSIPPNP